MKKIQNQQIFQRAFELTIDIRQLFVKRMKKLGLTQEDLALRMGKTRSNVAVLLTQKNIMSLPVIIDFCRALDIDLQIFFNERQPSVSIEDGITKEDNNGSPQQKEIYVC